MIGMGYSKRLGWVEERQYETYIHGIITKQLPEDIKKEQIMKVKCINNGFLDGEYQCMVHLTVNKIYNVEKEEGSLYYITNDLNTKMCGYHKSRFKIEKEDKSFKVRCINNISIEHLINIVDYYEVERESAKYYYLKGVGGWNKDRFEIINKEGTKMEYEKSRDFSAEDLRKAGACDYLIEEIIKYFGFTKIIPVDKNSIQIMGNIEDCIPFLKRRGFIREKVEEKFYRYGDKFIKITGLFHGFKYLLISIMNYAVLVDINTGCYWNQPIKINNHLKISEEEFFKICGGDLLFNKVDKW